MSTAPRITVVGSFMQARCWQLERLPASGESLAAHGFTEEPAGKGLAVAIGCRRLGAHVGLLLGLGDDAAADALLNRLAQERISTTHVERHTGPSGTGAGLIDAQGRNMIATFAGANARLDAAAVDRCAAAFEGAALVHAQLETPLEAAQRAFELGRAQGARTVLNPSPWQALPEALLALTQVLVVNESECRELLGGPSWPKTQAAQLAALWRRWRGPPGRLLVVTLGERGSVAFSDSGECVSQPAVPADVHDSIGAGDAFAAALCIALAQALPLTEALRRANASGAFAVARSGILNGLPHAHELGD